MNKVLCSHESPFLEIFFLFTFKEVNSSLIQSTLVGHKSFNCLLPKLSMWLFFTLVAGLHPKLSDVTKSTISFTLYWKHDIPLRIILVSSWCVMGQAGSERGVVPGYEHPLWWQTIANVRNSLVVVLDSIQRNHWWRTGLKKSRGNRKKEKVRSPYIKVTIP